LFLQKNISILETFVRHAQRKNGSLSPEKTIVDSPFWHNLNAFNLLLDIGYTGKIFSIYC